MATARRAGPRRGVTILEMMIVVTIVALMAGLTFPSVTSGLDSIRLRSAGDSVATFLAQAIARVERTEEPVELVIHRAEGRFQATALRPGFQRELVLGEGISVLHVYPEPMGAAPEMRSVLLQPGGAFPAIGIEILNRRGQRRLIRIDPLSGVPIVEIPSDSVSSSE
ncbi:MAG: prepilin-type N-terminal cleavage/methylation domain-containing protein [Candidatus Solibacter usitatus]|nr:prepilin-type N-terminal cleavage/methylation domain-containing protein [Candidatus Solibacter usitatus]